MEEKINIQPVHKRSIPPSRLLKYGIAFGIGLIAFGVIWGGIIQEQDLGQTWFPIHDLGFVLDVGLGLLIGVIFSLVFWFIGRFVPGFATIRERLIEIIDFRQIHIGHIIGISMAAALPEEIFFRGAMQPALGLWITALIFGVLHSITPLYFVYVTLAGLMLGGIFEWQDNLWMVTATHFGVDFISLVLLMRWVRNQTPDIFLDTGEHPTVE